MMPIIELVRMEEGEQGTLGALRINKEMFCCTLELPDRLNEKDKSSIPAQQYICERYKSPSWGLTYQVQNVSGRTGILFHSGNTASDSAGCILLGSRWGKLKGDRAVLNSGQTFKRFMNELVSFNEFHLTIFERY